MARYRRYTKSVFLILNLLVAVAYLLACFAPHLNPRQWWFFSVLGLGFPYLLLTLLVFIFFWLFFKPRFALVSLVALLAGYPGLQVFFGWHPAEAKFEIKKEDSTLRIVHWNVGRFVEWKRNNNRGSRTRLRMMDLLKEQNADVLCLQEFFHSTDAEYYDNLTYVQKELGYPYVYFAWDNDGHLQWVGNVIFSKRKLLDSGLIRFPAPSLPESLLWADVALGRDTLRLYTTHLQSVQFRKRDFERIEEIKRTEDGMVENSKNIFSKLKRGMVLRKLQADVVREVTRQSPHPYVLTGDFNDVPNSYTYYTIRGKELQDAFLEKGFGIGRTYTGIAPTLRIDYLLATKNISIQQFNRVEKVLSDHHMLMADVRVVH